MSTAKLKKKDPYAALRYKEFNIFCYRFAMVLPGPCNL
jgi:hypothetical protein